jgi:tRNA (guanine-N7-)-methyltransferase
VTTEAEFGVPFPGNVVVRDLWTQTSLKRLPTGGQLNWSDLFGRSAPIVLDVGCGNGRFLIGSATRRPGHDHLGVDILPVVIRYATQRANQRGQRNIRWAVAHARDFLLRLVPEGSVSEIHIYHPQPYYDLALVYRRLITPEFVRLVHRALLPGGLLVVQTDNPGYWRYMQMIVPLYFEWQELSNPWPDAPQGRTRREIIAMQRGMPVYRGHGRARARLDDAEVRRLAEKLPPPVFAADRRLRDLDKLA